MKEANNVLWTGGWDSTFRVIQLYRLGATIQPIYVIDHNRESSNKELDVVNTLIKEIPTRFKGFNGDILPLITVERRNIPSNPFLKLVYKRLKKEVNLGKQYYWLASLAKKYRKLELSIHVEDMSRFFHLRKLTELKDEQLGLNWRINQKKVDFSRRQLFKNMTFPLITTSKPDMKIIAEENDFIDLLESTWFCHKSGEKPCGICNPCKQYMRDGFGYRVK